MEPIKTIGDYFRHELVIDRSRFITHLQPTDTVEEAKAFIAEINKQHYDATHNCTAYIIHNDQVLQKANDDGEPSGTAGMPMLQALLQQNMVNITAVVTRYYGGIKLGAGGLIRAYAGSVTAALAEVPLMTYTTFATVTCTLSYDELNKLYYLQDTLGNFKLIDTVYDNEITVTLSMEQTRVAEIEQKFVEHLMRQLTFKIIGETTSKTFL